MNAAQLQARLNQAAKEIAQPREAMQKVVLIVEGRAKKGAPVDKGTLRRSVNSRVVSPTKGLVGSNLDYAPHVEMGTRYMAAQPFLEPAIRDSHADIERALQDFGNTVFRKVGR